MTSSCVQERFWFCMAPANLRNPVASAALMRFAQKYAARKPVGADIHFSQKTPATSEEMCEMEAVHQVQDPTRLPGRSSRGSMAAWAWAIPAGLCCLWNEGSVVWQYVREPM